jgi:hypothetical protein
MTCTEHAQFEITLERAWNNSSWQTYPSSQWSRFVTRLYFPISAGCNDLHHTACPTLFLIARQATTLTDGKESRNEKYTYFWNICFLYTVCVCVRACVRRRHIYRVFTKYTEQFYGAFSVHKTMKKSRKHGYLEVSFSNYDPIENRSA